MSARTVLHVLPHTHWDREWYEPFEGYRFRLVRVVDDLLGLLERDPTFHFHFDGQSAAIEDYLNVRPEAEPRVAALVQAKRLAIGPWRILMDEFLCSPETIVRNLRQGLATSKRLGADPEIGYIPDSFGHIAQMPQILSLAGMRAALAWRGVPSAVDRPLFRWHSPDGTSLRTMYLATSYSNGATLPSTFEELMVRAKRIVEDIQPFGPTGAVLAMCGSDHLGPQPHLPALFAEANERQDEIEFRIGSLADYLAEQPEDGWPDWHGEMRSSARANVLMGVLSARMPLKQAEAAASRALERYAEPLVALSAFDPGRMLDEAWLWMVENSAHDSVCGCGIDPVAFDVAGRYLRAERVASVVAAGSLELLAERIGRTGDGDGLLLFNPSPFPRAGVVEAMMPLPTHAELVRLGTFSSRLQALEETEQIVVDMTIRGAQLAGIVPTIHSRKMGTFYVNRMELIPGKIRTVKLELGPVEAGRFDVEAAKREVETEALANPRAKFRVLGAGPPLVRILVDAPAIGGLGWATLFPSIADDPPEQVVSAADGAIDNGLVRVQAAGDGTVALIHLSTGQRFDGIGLVDDGDAGDEYTWSPPDHNAVIERPGAETIETSAGALEARLVQRQTWRLPPKLDEARRRRGRGWTATPVQITWSVRDGEPFARAEIVIDNAAEDHRLRLRIPLPFTAEASDADGAFAVIRRGLESEGAVHETGTPAFPSRRWVDVSPPGDGAGIAAFHRGTPEYEITHDGHALEITLLRCVGWLSRQDLSTRSGPAGPMLPAPAAQLPGRHSFALALYPHEGDWRAGGVPRVAETYLYPMQATVVRANSGAAHLLKDRGSSLQIEPPAVQLSNVERRGDIVEIRVYNASDQSTNATITIGAPLPLEHAVKVDLLGRDLERLDVRAGVIDVAMRRWEIATISVS